LPRIKEGEFKSEAPSSVMVIGCSRDIPRSDISLALIEPVKPVRRTEWYCELDCDCDCDESCGEDDEEDDDENEDEDDERG